MEISLQLEENDGKKAIYNIDKIKFHKMVFLFNALDDGWSVKKRKKSYYFIKNHEGKKEILSDNYLSTFMKDNIDLTKIFSLHEK